MSVMNVRVGGDDVMPVIDLDYYINVYDLMMIDVPKCRLPRPKMKPSVFVMEDEWLPLITVETGV